MEWSYGDRHQDPGGFKGNFLEVAEERSEGEQINSHIMNIMLRIMNYAQNRKNRKKQKGVIFNFNLSEVIVSSFNSWMSKQTRDK